MLLRVGVAPAQLACARVLFHARSHLLVRSDGASLRAVSLNQLEAWDAEPGAHQ